VDITPLLVAVTKLRVTVTLISKVWCAFYFFVNKQQMVLCYRCYRLFPNFNFYFFTSKYSLYREKEKSPDRIPKQLVSGNSGNSVLALKTLKKTGNNAFSEKNFFPSF
jgi:hypothetical protein